MNRAANWLYRHAHQVLVMLVAAWLISGNEVRPIQSLLTGLEAGITIGLISGLRSRFDPWFRS